MAASGQEAYSWPGEEMHYYHMLWKDLEKQAEFDESMFGYEGFMARFEIYLREHDL